MTRNLLTASLRRTAPILIALAVSGCLAGGPVGPNDGSEEDPGVIPLAFSEPVRFVSEKYAYEPSLVVAENGLAVVTARKANHTNDGTQLSSWLRYSNDGTQWHDFPSPQGLQSRMLALEGDLALDAAGNLYFVDIYLADTWLHTWSLQGGTPEWVQSRPALGSVGTDDRPWLAAQGDGVVYYLANNGAEPPGPNHLTTEPQTGAKVWFYRSLDHGATWSLGHGFADTVWCTIAAQREDTGVVVVGCLKNDAAGGGQHEAVYVSQDSGQTWTERDLGPIQTKPGQWFPSTAIDGYGTAYHAWIDDDLDDDEPGRILVAQSDDLRTWQVYDVTPYAAASYGMVWIDGSAEGRLGMSFYATEDLAPTTQRQWFVHGMVLPSDFDNDTRQNAVRADEVPIAVDLYPPVDFFQCAMGPDEALHIAYQRFHYRGVSAAGARIHEYANDGYFVRQAVDEST